jgi:hypothetical protein
MPFIGGGAARRLGNRRRDRHAGEGGRARNLRKVSHANFCETVDPTRAEDGGQLCHVDHVELYGRGVGWVG